MMHGQLKVKYRIITEFLHKHDTLKAAVIRQRGFGSFSETVSLVFASCFRATVTLPLSLLITAKLLHFSWVCVSSVRRRTCNMTRPKFAVCLHRITLTGLLQTAEQCRAIIRITPAPD